MTLIELLQQIFSATDEQTAAFTNGMKENGIYMASEENMDIRYGKLKGEHETLSKQLGEANTTIETLKKSTKGQEEAQKQIAAYEQQVAQLQTELAATRFDSEARYGLLSANATDVDYALYKLKEAMKADGKECTVDENGKIPGWADLLSSLQTKIPAQFKEPAKKQIIENRLPEVRGGGEVNPASLAEALQMQYENN